MAQYFFDKLHCLGRAGERIDNGGYLNSEDAGFLASAPYLRYYSNRTSTGTSIILLPVPAVANADIRIKYRYAKNGTDNYHNTGPAIVFRWSSIGDYLYAGTPSRQSNSYGAAFYKLVGGTQTDVASASSAWDTVDLGVWKYFRAKLQGDQYQWCDWQDGETEPSLSSASTVSISDAPATGAIGLRGRSYGALFDIAHIAIGTDGDAPPISLSGADNEGTISGVILDSNGDPCAREVRAYLRETGGLVGYTISDATTGAYSITTQFAGEEHNVEVIDAEDELYLQDLFTSRIVAA